jgi:chromosomal replication initiation ATPase DnaA
MTRATFDSWLKNTTAVQQNGTLVVSAASPYALDWLENRLRYPIEQAVTRVAGHELEVQFKIVEEPGEQSELFFTGTYRDAYNEIVQPDKQHYTSWYFHRAWLPLLGPELWLLLWEMRTRCYWNKETGIKRDTFEATYEQLGQATGMSKLKAWRLLHPKEPDQQALLAKFIMNAETKRRYSKGRGGKVNDKTIWKIRLDDP